MIEVFRQSNPVAKGVHPEYANTTKSESNPGRFFIRFFSDLYFSVNKIQCFLKCFSKEIFQSVREDIKECQKNSAGKIRRREGMVF
jgi:hypothetical protein